MISSRESDVARDYRWSRYRYQPAISAQSHLAPRNSTHLHYLPADGSIPSSHRALVGNSLSLSLRNIANNQSMTLTNTRKLQREPKIEQGQGQAKRSATVVERSNQDVMKVLQLLIVNSEHSLTSSSHINVHNERSVSRPIAVQAQNINFLTASRILFKLFDQRLHGCKRHDVLWPIDDK